MAVKNGIALLAASALGAAAAFADAVKASAEYPEFYNGDTTMSYDSDDNYVGSWTYDDDYERERLKIRNWDDYDDFWGDSDDYWW